MIADTAEPQAGPHTQAVMGGTATPALGPPTKTPNQIAYELCELILNPPSDSVELAERLSLLLGAGPISAKAA